MKKIILDKNFYNKEGSNVVIVDLDNTLYDALGELVNRFEGTDKTMQTHYSFHKSWGPDLGEKMLQEFHKEDFLNNLKINKEVLNTLKTKFKDEKILIITKTKDENAQIRLDKILKDDPYLKEHVIGLIAWQQSYPLDEIKHLDVLALIDDNPNNLYTASKVGIPTIRVKHIYNYHFPSDHFIELDYIKDYVDDRVFSNNEAYKIYLGEDKMK